MLRGLRIRAGRQGEGAGGGGEENAEVLKVLIEFDIIPLSWCFAIVPFTCFLILKCQSVFGHFMSIFC